MKSNVVRTITVGAILVTIIVVVAAIIGTVRQDDEPKSSAPTATITVTATATQSPTKVKDGSSLTQTPPPLPVFEPKPPKHPAMSYTVKPGDTLWDISKAFSGDPTWFKDIVTASWIKNPGLIYSGQILTIPAIQ